MNALFQAGAILSACVHAQAGGKVQAASDKRFSARSMKGRRSVKALSAVLAFLVSGCASPLCQVTYEQVVDGRPQKVERTYAKAYDPAADVILEIFFSVFCVLTVVPGVMFYGNEKDEYPACLPSEQAVFGDIRSQGATPLSYRLLCTRGQSMRDMFLPGRSGDGAVFFRDRVIPYSSAEMPALLSPPASADAAILFGRLLVRAPVKLAAIAVVDELDGERVARTHALPTDAEGFYGLANIPPGRSFRLQRVDVLRGGAKAGSMEMGYVTHHRSSSRVVFLDQVTVNVTPAGLALSEIVSSGAPGKEMTRLALGRPQFAGWRQVIEAGGKGP